MARTLSHVGIAVRDLEAAKRTFGALFGIERFHEEIVTTQGVRIASFPAGDSRVELTAAAGDESPIARFLAARGEGIHHLAFTVDDIDGEMARLAAAGFPFTSAHPDEGAHGMRVAFLHPKNTHGVLIELCQESRAKS